MYLFIYWFHIIETISRNIFEQISDGIRRKSTNNTLIKLISFLQVAPIEWLDNLFTAIFYELTTHSSMSDYKWLRIKSENILVNKI